PYEPPILAWRATGDRLLPRLFTWLLQARRTRDLRRRLDAAGIASNDWILGLSDSGVMRKERVRGYVTHLPEGVSELYVHAATGPWTGPGAWPADYDGSGELEALTDPDV